MSFDYFFKFIWLTNYFEKFPEPNGEEFPMERYFKHIENSKELNVILPPWRSGSFITKFLNRRLLKAGKSCLFYSFSPDVLSPDPKITIREFRKIKAVVSGDIAELKNKFGYSKVNLIASSLGSVWALMIANGNDNINNLFLIVPGSRVSSSLWHGIRTQKLRKIYEQKGINLEMLQELYQEIEPKNNADRLENKNIYISISKSDKIVPYEYGKELADIMEGSKTIIEENKFLGHYLSVIKFYLFCNLEN